MQMSVAPALLSSYLQSLTDEFSDVILECDGYKFRSHKVILAAHSKYFSALFGDNFEDGDNASPPVFHLEEVTKAGLEQILNLIYCRPVVLDMSMVWQVLKDADFLLLDQITGQCSEFISSNLKVTNCLTVFGLLEKLNFPKLRSHVEEFILDNFSLLEGADEFMALSPSDLVRWLKDDRLVVNKEEDLWRLVMSWIMGNEERMGRKERKMWRMS